MAVRYGALAERVESVLPDAVEARGVPVYVGVAPINTVPGGAAVINQPVLVRNMTEAVKKLGYSDDWASYPLCEAMWEHFAVKNVGPVVFIHAATLAQMGEEEGDGSSETPANGKIVLTGMGKTVIDSLTVGTKVLGTDYTVEYDYKTETIIIKETSAGSLGTSALSISYDVVDPSEVTANAIIGTDDGEGTRTGLYAVHDIYEKCGVYPTDIACPGFSSTKTVHDAMETVSQKISGHYYACIWTDIPLLSGASTAMTLANAASWKSTNGYTCENEKTFFPMYEDADGRKHHISVTALACKQALDAENGLPYMSSANQEADIVKLYFGDGIVKTPGESVLNETLIAHGISTAAFVSGRWVIWGAHMAGFEAGVNENALNIADTGMQMLYHIMNDFQERRGTEIWHTMSKNRMEQIAAEENSRLALKVHSGALLYGKCRLDTAAVDADTVRKGDFDFVFDITTNLLTKSVRALVRYTDEGVDTLIEEVYA